jgi:hypothetical protein
MSLATLKKKTKTKYNNMSVSGKGFSLYGTTRNQAFIGQDNLARSFPRTIMKTGVPHGYGGCCGKFASEPVIDACVSNQNDNDVVKSGVVNTSGLLSLKRRKYLNENGDVVSQVVKPLGADSSLRTIWNREEAILNADDAECQRHVYNEVDCRDAFPPEYNDVTFDTNGCPVCVVQNHSRKYTFVKKPCQNIVQSLEPRSYGQYYAGKYSDKFASCFNNNTNYRFTRNTVGYSTTC